MLNPEMLKTSTVLAAMAKGLKKSKSDLRFELDIMSCGKVTNEMCYGCTALVTFVEMFGQGKTPSEVMIAYAKTRENELERVNVGPAEALNLDRSRSESEFYNTLAHVIESAQKGNVSHLIGFFTGSFDSCSFDSRWNLKNDNWEGQLPLVESTILEIIAVGL
jgi:hypothetical protein